MLAEPSEFEPISEPTLPDREDEDYNPDGTEAVSDEDDRKPAVKKAAEAAPRHVTHPNAHCSKHKFCRTTAASPLIDHVAKFQPAVPGPLAQQMQTISPFEC